MKRKALLLYGLLFYPIISNALFIRWIDVNKKTVFRIDTKKNALEKETNLKEWIEIGEVSLKSVVDNEILESNRLICLNTNDKNLIYLLIDCTNQVYQFNYKTLFLERLDKTYYRGFNCGSTRFIRNKTIYSFGGYGLFRTNNLLAYFQEETKEWDAVNFENEAPKSNYKGLSGYIKETDSFITGLNFYYSDSENSGKILNDFGVYQYKFKDNKWYKLGEIKQSIIRSIASDGYGRNFHWNGKYFIVRFFKAPFNNLIIIDPFKNEVFQWIDKKRLFDVTVPDINNELEKEFVLEDSLFSYKYVTTGNRNYTSKISISIEKTKNDATYIGKLYESDDYSSWIVLVFIGVVLLIIFVLIYLKFLKNRIINKNKLGGVNNLNDVDIEMIKILIENFDKGGISTEQISTFLNINDKSIENQRKIRHEFIKSINLKLKMIYNIDNSIEKIPSMIDKRIFDYQLNSEIIQELKEYINE